MKRKSQQSLLPTDLISSLEESDKKASKKRKKQFNSHTLPKSLATKSLYNIHTNLIECRILLQRALTSSDDEKALDQEKDDSDNDSLRTNKGLERLLSRLVNAREMLCKKVLDKPSSSSNDEEDDGNDDGSAYNKLQKQWKKVLNRQHDNLNITKRINNKKDSNSKFFQVVDQSFWSQIENTVQHNKILDQHSQIQKDDSGGEDNMKPIVSFNDSKIYQHMLQEYITLSTERSTNNATSMAERRLKLASSNKKTTKHDYDRAASKGRKIKYVVHEKLQNFTFPLQREAAGTNHMVMDEDVLFKSMMGGVSQRKKK